MKILIDKMQGDAAITIYNKQGEVIHVEQIEGKTTSTYIREIPVDVAEYGSSKALFSGTLEYKVVA
jgi:hypothetical protein